MNLDLNECKIAVVGLGYVGLPLLIELAKKYPCIGFDIQERRIRALRDGNDSTNELSAEELQAVTVEFSADANAIADCDVYIVTVPTPIDQQKRPYLEPLIRASSTIAPFLSKDNIVIYESTVYPGATEEVCVPLLEAGSGLGFNTDFFAGYSPERINPGDKQHRISTITKVTSGSTPEACEFVDRLYSSIVTAGTYPVSSIRVAEAAKVIENTQRDLNIALINELCIIFNKLNIDTEEVLLAAGTKWNFLPFRPGLVGGHCISVDPYYLTHKSQEIGYHPEVILAGRRINDGMGQFIAERVIKRLTQQRIHVVDSKILIMGLSFKENCPDLRNTRVIDIAETLTEFNSEIDIHDPWVSAEEARHEYGVDLIEQPETGKYDAIIVAVAHDKFRELGVEAIRSFGKENSVIFDVKYMFPRGEPGVTRL